MDAHVGLALARAVPSTVVAHLFVRPSRTRGHLKRLNHPRLDWRWRLTRREIAPAQQNERRQDDELFHNGVGSQERPSSTLPLAVLSQLSQTSPFETQAPVALHDDEQT
jgi:hypothetical protein